MAFVSATFWLLTSTCREISSNVVVMRFAAFALPLEYAKRTQSDWRDLLLLETDDGLHATDVIHFDFDPIAIVNGVEDQAVLDLEV